MTDSVYCFKITVRQSHTRKKRKHSLPGPFEGHMDLPYSMISTQSYPQQVPSAWLNLWPGRQIGTSQEISRHSSVGWPSSPHRQSLQELFGKENYSPGVHTEN